MNLRRRLNDQPMQLPLAPMIDVILFLLCFFLLTWNLARYEQDLDIKVPQAKNAKDPTQLPGEVIINLRADGTVELERTPVSITVLEDKLKTIAQAYPDQPIVFRAAESAKYTDVIKVLDTCRAANLTNIAFATSREDKS